MNFTIAQPLEELHECVLESFRKVTAFEATSVYPSLINKHVTLEFGVLVGIIGDLKGKILYSGKEKQFGVIGERMYGMELEGEMLHSFVGELGNMLSGNLCTAVSAKGLTLDITAPTVMSGDCKISGFKEAVELVLTTKEFGNLLVYILLDEQLKNKEI